MYIYIYMYIHILECYFQMQNVEHNITHSRPRRSSLRCATFTPDSPELSQSCSQI